VLKSNWFWFIVLGGIVIISAFIALQLRQVPAGYAHIYRDGELTDTVNVAGIFDPFTITLEYEDNINIIAVEQGRIRMISANCPDGTCVRQGWMSGGAFPIVCLPNRIVITLKGGVNENGIDAVVG